MKTLDKVEKLLARYTPQQSEQDKIYALAKILHDMNDRLEAVKWDEAQANQIAALVADGTLDLSTLVERDRTLLPTIRIHTHGKPKTMFYGSARSLKISIGWPAEKIKPALPYWLDENLKQDLADFADTRLQITVGYNGFEHFANFSNRNTVIKLEHPTGNLGDLDMEARKKVLDVFPVVNDIVDLRGMLTLLKPHFDHRMDVWHIGHLWSSWPVPEEFTWEEKIRRYATHEQLLKVASGLPTADVYVWNWRLTDDAAKELLEDVMQGGIAKHKAFVKRQFKIVKRYQAECRSHHWEKVRDENGFLSMALVKKMISDERHLVKMEKKHGVKRRLEICDPDVKGECKICKKHITQIHWQKHINSRTHMQKGLKLS